MARRAAAARRGRHEDEQRRHDEDARNEASSGGATTTSGGGGATNGRSERKPNRMVDHSLKAPLHNVDSMGQTHTRTCTQLTVTNAVYARGGTARQRQLAGLVQLGVVVRGGTRTIVDEGRPKSKHRGSRGCGDLRNNARRSVGACPRATQRPASRLQGSAFFRQPPRGGCMVLVSGGSAWRCGCGAGGA